MRGKERGSKDDPQSARVSRWSSGPASPVKGLRRVDNPLSLIRFLDREQSEYETDGDNLKWWSNGETGKSSEDTIVSKMRFQLSPIPYHLSEVCQTTSTLSFFNAAWPALVLVGLRSMIIANCGRHTLLLTSLASG